MTVVVHKKLLAVVGAALLLPGCAATSLFKPYPIQAADFRAAITAAPAVSADPAGTSLAAGLAAAPGAAGTHTADIMRKLDRRRTGADGTLYLMERGRIAQLQGDYATSKTDFEQVIANMQAADDKAMLSASGGVALGAALLTNDNAIPYKASDYERVLVHLFQVFNYLGLKDIEGATIELRRAQQVQREIELRHDKEVSEARGEAAQNNINVGEFDQYFSGMDTIAGKVKNSFQNGYVFYTAAMIREALGEYNDAMVDLKKTLEMAPNNRELRDDVIRLNRYFGGGNKTNGKTGVVVVLYEQDFVPQKSAIGLPIPTMDGGVFSIQFPIYSGSDYVPVRPINVRFSTGTKQTMPLADTGALAVKAHREKIVGLLVRQVLRARAKYELQKQAADQGGLVGQFAANIYNVVSEQADLRSWLTLPAHGQGTRLVLPAGQQTIELVTGTGNTPVNIEVRAGRTTIIRAVEANYQLITQTFAL